MLYDLLKICVSVFFHGLNKLLGGNLPPFGSAAVIVEQDGRYLAVILPRGRTVFPGGFMKWRELPIQTAVREGKEETGLELIAGDLIGYYPQISQNWRGMNNVSFVYQARVVGGTLRKNIEGRPCWLPEAELRKRLDKHSQDILNDYQYHYAGKSAIVHTVMPSSHQL